MRFLQLASILFLQILAACPAPVNAEEPLRLLASDALGQQLPSSPIADVERKIRAQDRQIFLELVKLAEFNVRYQQTVNHCSRWRKVVYPLGQEAVYAGFLGYSLTDISQRSRGWNDPRLISSTTAKESFVVRYGRCPAREHEFYS